MTHVEGRYVGPRRRLAILSPAEIARVHETTLEILSEVGVVFYSKRALDVLAEHGATVDYETTVAKLPPELVERAMSTIPRTITLGSRTPEYDLPIDGEHAYVTSDGCAVFVRDADGSVHSSTKRDVADADRKSVV